MRPSERLRRAGVVMLVLALGGQAPVVSGAERFRVDSQPSGAQVFTITGPAGTTPLSLSERDIYPNRYPPQDIDLYGILILRRDGCRDMRHRVTRSEMAEGVQLRLECDAAAAAAPMARPADTSSASAEAATDRSTAPATAASAPGPETTAAGAESPAQRRLRQLRVIQELHDEGLLSDAEERDIRRRILQAD